MTLVGALSNRPDALDTLCLASSRCAANHYGRSKPFLVSDPLPSGLTDTTPSKALLSSRAVQPPLVGSSFDESDFP